MIDLLDCVKFSWWDIIKKEMVKPYFKEITVSNPSSNKTLYPQRCSIFKAFTYFEVKDTKVVIIGQDPYPNLDQAMGLAFSVPNEVEQLPASLTNIYMEVNRSMGDPCSLLPSNGCLENWAKQGVLLLNSALTVETEKQEKKEEKQEKKEENQKNRKEKIKSHEKLWLDFTIAIINEINTKASNVVFCFWGKEAAKKESLIKWNKKGHHLVLITSHPGRQGAYLGFKGCGHFQMANNWLKSRNQTEINWRQN